MAPRQLVSNCPGILRVPEDVSFSEVYEWWCRLGFVEVKQIWTVWLVVLEGYLRGVLKVCGGVKTKLIGV